MSGVTVDKVRVLAVGLTGDGWEVPAVVAGAACRKLELADGSNPDQAAAQLVHAVVGAGPSAGGVAVTVAREPAALAAVAAAAGALDGVLAVPHLDAAGRLVELLAAGRTPASLVYPPLPVTDVAALPLAVVEGPVTEGQSWLQLGPAGVQVAGGSLPPLQRTALLERAALGGPAAGAGGPASVDQAARALLIGPANWGGQGQAWAQAVVDYLPGWRAQALAVVGRPVAEFHDADLTVQEDDWLRPVTRADLAWQAVGPASHVLLESLRPLVAVDQAREPDLDAPGLAWGDIGQLQAAGRRVAVVLHPGDLDRLTAAGVAHLTAAGLPTFVSSPELLDALPGAAYLPPVLGRWALAPAEPVLQPGITPRVARLLAGPAEGPLGVALEAGLGHLAALGLIDYRRWEPDSPALAPALVARAVRQVDVVVDRLEAPGLSLIGLQALAAGRLVLANLPAGLARRYPQPPPVLAVGPGELTDLIAEVALVRPAYRDLAATGPAYAAAVHGGEVAARVLARDFLADPAEGTAA
ncbi:MAG: hypothetical protein LBR19_03510 [Bifidobacteriaceae bacterium]|jgi:hypothetical protein|nr:hypothetical protein [Bifidobacteriaceae bacterium]